MIKRIHLIGKEMGKRILYFWVLYVHVRENLSELQPSFESALQLTRGQSSDRSERCGLLGPSLIAGNFHTGPVEKMWKTCVTGLLKKQILKAYIYKCSQKGANHPWFQPYHNANHELWLHLLVLSSRWQHGLTTWEIENSMFTSGFCSNMAEDPG